MSIMSLSELQRGQSGQIVSIRTDTPGRAQELMSMGILPGSAVRVIENFSHHVIFGVELKKFAADRTVAGEIWVSMI